MSVYTCINKHQLEKFLLLYSLGELVDFAGIQAGIENTNYTVSTTQGEFILTIFEKLTAKDLPCLLDLLKHLGLNNFPAPEPQVCKESGFLNTFKGKPVALFNRLPGRSIVNPSIEQCEEIGVYLARLHLYGKQFSFHKLNSKNLAGCQSVFNKIRPQLTKDDIDLLDSELDFQSSCILPDLPQGIIHADLFKDNVLFDKGRVSGILDFYNACNDYVLFDIAVTSNDCCAENQSINQQKLLALLSGYQSIKRLTDDEIKYLPVFLRLAALRFWLSRLEHQLNPKTGELTLEKDPLVFRQLLEYHRSQTMNVVSEEVI